MWGHRLEGCSLSVPLRVVSEDAVPKISLKEIEQALTGATRVEPVEDDATLDRDGVEGDMRRHRLVPVI